MGAEAGGRRRNTPQRFEFPGPPLDLVVNITRNDDDPAGGPSKWGKKVGRFVTWEPEGQRWRMGSRVAPNATPGQGETFGGWRSPGRRIKTFGGNGLERRALAIYSDHGNACLWSVIVIGRDGEGATIPLVEIEIARFCPFMAHLESGPPSQVRHRQSPSGTISLLPSGVASCSFPFRRSWSREKEELVRRVGRERRRSWVRGVEDLAEVPRRGCHALWL